jgi:hypothetical protein
MSKKAPKGYPKVGTVMFCNSTKNCYKVLNYVIDDEDEIYNMYQLLWLSGSADGEREYYPVGELDRDTVATDLIKALA